MFWFTFYSNAKSFQSVCFYVSLSPIFPSQIKIFSSENFLFDLLTFDGLYLVSLQKDSKPNVPKMAHNEGQFDLFHPQDCLVSGFPREGVKESQTHTNTVTFALPYPPQVAWY